MNFQVFSDQATTITALFYFDGVKKGWRTIFDLNPGDKVKTEAGTNGVIFTIVGRRPQEVEKIELKWDGHEATIYPDDDGEYAPVTVYSGGRDFWTNQLRAKALESTAVVIRNEHGSSH